MKRLPIIAISVTTLYFALLHIIYNFDSYHDPIITPVTQDYAQASINSVDCMSQNGYDTNNVHGKIIKYKDVSLELAIVGHIPCGSGGYVIGNKIVLKNLKDSPGLYAAVAAHEAYHWCKGNGFERNTGTPSYDEEVMAYCVGDIVEIIYSNL